MKILFFDPTAKYPYTSKSLVSQAMGASEGSLMRVARALAKEPSYEVCAFQVVDQSRPEKTIEGVRHVNLHSKLEPDVIVHQRTARFVEAMAEQYPKARHIVWMHDLGDESWLRDEPLANKTLVCVSDFHVKQMYGELWKVEQAEGLTMHHIYNPIELDGATPQPKVKGRLGFFSSPQKGFDQVRKLFQELCLEGRKLELVFANPGYLPDSTAADTGLINLGQLPHPLALKELSKCELLFYPQTVFPETFGCVLAEANAMGVPVLCHDFGAAKEVVGYGSIIDCNDTAMVRRVLDHRLDDSYSHFIPVADPKFSIEVIIAQWKKLFEGDV